MTQSYERPCDERYWVHVATTPAPTERTPCASANGGADDGRAENDEEECGDPPDRSLRQPTPCRDPENGDTGAFLHGAVARGVDSMSVPPSTVARPAGSVSSSITPIGVPRQRSIA